METKNIIAKDLHSFDDFCHLNASYRMDHFKYSKDFDASGNLKPAMEITQVDCEHEHVQTNLYNAHFCYSTMTTHNSANTFPDDSCYQSGGSQLDANMFSDFRPFIHHYNDNKSVDDNYTQPFNGLPQPENVSYYTDERCHTEYRPSNEEYSELRTAVASITDLEKNDFQNVAMDENSCRLSTQQLLEELPYFQKNACSSMVLCQNGNNKILYINNPDTGEIKTYQLLSEPEEQFYYNPSHSARTENIRSLTDAPNPSPVLKSFLPLASMPHITIHNMDNGSVYALINDAIFQPESNIQEATSLTLTGIPVSMLDNKSKRPCNCTKSQCLKLYCDCFANGEFCSNCNCNNCYNNIHHELERFKAIKACLDRNPEAFQPKIGKIKTGDFKPRHTKGCNCKRSGCLKNYCECYEAKIMCSSMCKCIGCKNYEESPDRKSLRNMQKYADAGSIIQACTSLEVVRATCACLLAQAEEAEKEGCSSSLAEQMVIEEFGKSLAHILHTDVQGETC